jgi:hypothetical protein
MTLSRGVRDEQLILRTSAGDRVLGAGLDRVFGWDYARPSQRRFQVSPDARVLAHLTPGSGDLRLLYRGGSDLAIDVAPGHDFRFSPDGSELVVVRKVGAQYCVDRVDVRAKEVRPGPFLPEPRWIEHSARGILVAHASDRAGGEISLLAPGRPPEMLVRDEWEIDRFAAATAGSRFVFVKGEAWSVEGPGATPKSLGVHSVRNLELSADGRLLGIATDTDVHLFEGDQEVKRWPTVSAHSLWFTPRGELAWASESRAACYAGGVEHALDTIGSKGYIEGLRVARGGTGLVVARRGEVTWWNPDLDEETTLARQEDADRLLLGADVFAGGVVMWVGTRAKPGRGT